MSTTLKHSGLTERLTRHEFANLIVRIGKKLDLSKTAIAILSYYIKDRTFDDDYIANRICAVWPKVKDTAYNLGLSVKSVNNAERELEEKGFVVRTTGGNGYREGKRSNDGDKRVEWAHGVNLAPTIERACELERKALALELEKNAIELVRSEIRHTNKLIRKATDPNLLARAKLILPNGRTARISEIARLKFFLGELRVVLDAINDEVGVPKSSDASEENDVPIYKTKLNKKFSTSNHEQFLEITPRLVMKIADEEFRQSVVNIGDKSWRGIVEIASQFAYCIGIDQKLWAIACGRLGRERAALCVIIIHRNYNLPSDDKFRAINPAACLGGMVRSVTSGKFDLSGLISFALSRNEIG